MSADAQLTGFQPFPKIGRLTRECVVTEKLDGTNAQVHIVPRTEVFSEHAPFIVADFGGDIMFAGSRTRYVTPDADNYGFATWVKANADALFALGPGRHYGEWWGQKVQRGYSLTEKRFSLFNTTRWTSWHAEDRFGRDLGGDMLDKQEIAPRCCHVVPELYRGLFSDRIIDNMLEMLRHKGSVAAPGFMDPEGIVAFHTATGVLFKKTLVGDEYRKGATASATA